MNGVLFLDDYSLIAIITGSPFSLLRPSSTQSFCKKTKVKIWIKPQDKPDWSQDPLYKTALCNKWEETEGSCEYGESCRFAHGIVTILNLLVCHIIILKELQNCGSSNPLKMVRHQIWWLNQSGTEAELLVLNTRPPSVTRWTDHFIIDHPILF